MVLYATANSAQANTYGNLSETAHQQLDPLLSRISKALEEALSMGLCNRDAVASVADRLVGVNLKADGACSTPLPDGILFSIERKVEALLSVTQETSSEISRIERAI